MQRSQTALARLASRGRRQVAGDLGPHASVSPGELEVADPPGEGATCPLKEWTCGNGLSHLTLRKDSLSPASSKAGGEAKVEGKQRI